MGSLSAILALMVAISFLERLRPLRRPRRDRLWPNLALTGLTIGISAGFNGGLVAALARRHGVASPALVVVALDFAAWLAHVAMHKSALLWRFHRVHHSD